MCSGSTTASPEDGSKNKPKIVCSRDNLDTYCSSRTDSLAPNAGSAKKSLKLARGWSVCSARCTRKRRRCRHVLVRTRTRAVDGELLAPHELVDELGDELLGVLVGPVHVVPSRDDDGKVEGPGDQSHNTYLRKPGRGGHG